MEEKYFVNLKFCVFVAGWLILPVCPLRHYYFVDKPLTWSEAQTYCRQKYTDLVTIENAAVMSQIQELVSSSHHNTGFWIGLYSTINWKWSDGLAGNPELYWSDGSSFSWSNFIPFGTLMGWQTVLCAFTSVKEEMQWRLKSCEARLPFVCYSPHGDVPQGGG
uniref:C-type lectin domain-containing protein n=1 Tax=Stegastes partitus TaxID=144197 RepID=A0A3B4ZWE9_9TELE